MHQTSYDRMKYLVEYYLPFLGNGTIKVLDIGSYDVNGSYKEIFSGSNYHYTGLDMVDGPNVDVVPKDIYNWSEIPDDSFDLVISGQAFEHIEYPWLTIKEIARILKPSGFCIITAPNAAEEHRYPTDCYRYFSDGFIALAKWAELHPHHTSVAGIPGLEYKDKWLSQDNDAFLVAQKKPINNTIIKDPFIYEQRFQKDGEKLITPITYKDESIAKEEILKTTSKPLILFGSGRYGTLALSLFGHERVFCFGDNSENKINTVLDGKSILSADEIAKVHKDYTVIVCIKSSTADIINQLGEKGIPSISFFSPK